MANRLKHAMKKKNTNPVKSHLPQPSICSFASWSGGKDSCLALYLAEMSGYEVKFLINMLTGDGQYSRSHGLRRSLLERQAESMGKEIVFGRAGWENYEPAFKDRLQFLKKRDSLLRAGVFGDIDLQDHRDWVERVCRSVDLEAYLPLWNKGREELLETFFEAGFKAAIVCIKESELDAAWLGRVLDHSAVDEFRRIGIDLCGENGEYHSFVFDGPIFSKPVAYSLGQTQSIDGYSVVELLP